jgi:sec-independent protein translocase protein TatB
MFDVGFTELLLLFVIGLLILGPERLPKVASQLGRWVGRARRTATQLRHQLEREIALDELTRAQKKPPPQKKPQAGAGTEPAPGTASESPAADATTAPPPASSGDADGTAAAAAGDPAATPDALAEETGAAEQPK